MTKMQLFVAILLVVAASLADADGQLRGDAAEESAAIAEELEANMTDEFTLEIAAADSCSSGYVAQLRKAAPACINSCKGSCGALNAAIHAYAKKGGAGAAKKVVCRYKGAFSCFVRGRARKACMKLISRAAAMGFKLPRSVGQLYAQCRWEPPVGGTIVVVRWMGLTPQESPLLAGPLCGWPDEKDFSRGVKLPLFSKSADAVPVHRRRGSHPLMALLLKRMSDLTSTGLFIRGIPRWSCGFVLPFQELLSALCFELLFSRSN
jgi:hypothetical protein